MESNAQTVPAFTSLPVETGQYGSGYSYNITTSDVESHPRTISLASGTLPAGLTLLDNTDGTALLSGTPSESGLFTFELGVTDVDGTALQEINLDISKAPLTATADDQTKVYGTANPGLTIQYAGFVNGDDATDITAPTISTTADASSAVGSYPITLIGGSAANYTLTLVDGSLTVTPAALTATADDQTKVYGTTNPVLTIDYAGFVNGDDATDITAPIISTIADASSAVGSYPITLIGGSATNYTLTLVDGSLSVTPAALTATADDQTKVYGTTNPTLTIDYAGFVNGDDATAITEPTINTTVDASSAVGSYPITLSGGSATNYTLTLVDGSLSVTPAALTATADDQTKVYGTTNPTLTIDYAGFVNGDDATAITEPTINTTVDASSAVGSYPITLSGGSTSNYTLTLVDGTLSVTPAVLTATADDQTKVYGTANPLLTIDYAGFVNGDDATDIIEPTI
ncbi:MAG: MBG domain-containing protein, partial [Fulvivirga sp.]